MLINEEIIKTLENNDLNVGLYLTLLFAIEQKLSMSFFLLIKMKLNNYNN